MPLRALLILLIVCLSPACDWFQWEEPGGVTDGDTDQELSDHEVACTCSDVNECCDGCQPIAEGMACNDGVACTDTDRCQSGVCSGDIGDGWCLIDDECVEDSADSPENFCRFCDAAYSQNQWRNKPNGIGCDDDDLCTHSDVCTAGECTGEVIVCESTACLERACNGSDSCTETAINEGGFCDDGDFCTVDGQCANGVCIEQARDCSEVEGPCADSRCDSDEAACLPVPINEGLDCDDNDNCSTASACEAGVCVETEHLNDCPATWTCGPSPSGCATCGDLAPGEICENHKARTVSEGFVPIMAGTFWMGEGDEEDEPRHVVRLTYNFELAETETTQGQFASLMGYNPSYFKHCGDNCPVESLSWHETLAYANVKSRMIGLPECFDCTGEGAEINCALKSEYPKPQDCPGYRLPTEAEWEWAARAGVHSARTYLGDGVYGCDSPDPILDAIGWYCANCSVEYEGCLDLSEQEGPECAGTQPVRQKLPNAWGLYDILGNVWEFVWDGWDGSPYPNPEEMIIDPIGDGVSERHSVRGSAYWASQFSSSNRFTNDTIPIGGRSVGFRLARSFPDDAEGAAGMVAADAHYTCAITLGGKVRCWGAGYYGNLANGIPYDENHPRDNDAFAPGSPLDLPGKAASVSLGDHHACSLLIDGRVYCWGYNAQGQCGVDDLDGQYRPVQVQGLADDIVDVKASYRHTCALDSSGNVFCWGYNNAGQLGWGEFNGDSHPVPDQVLGLGSEAVSLGLGTYHSCAILLDGRAQCWGHNWYGTLGDGTTTQRIEPADVLNSEGSNSLSGVLKLDSGESYSCAMVSSGKVYCWGKGSEGNLGQADLVNEQKLPVLLDSIDQIVINISVSRNSTCARSQDNLFCWGNSNKGELGAGYGGTTLFLPTKVLLTSEILPVDVTVGDAHSCGRYGDGSLSCWGMNTYGELGHGDQNDMYAHAPIKLEALDSPAQSISANNSYVCAALQDGTGHCWGGGGSGQLGQGERANSANPVAIATLDNIASIASGFYHACVLTEENTVYCWGENHRGQLGQGDTEDQLTPQLIPDLENITQLDSGWHHSCALNTNGSLKCWGVNGNLQLGNASSAQSETPTQVSGLESGVRQVSVNRYHGCALLETSQAMCWGYNKHGQLGDSTNTQRSTPVFVLESEGESFTRLTSVIKVATAGFHSCALLSDETMKCWGYGRYGQLGDGTSENMYTAVSVLADESGTPLSGVADIFLGGHTTSCAIMKDGGQVKCWGEPIDKTLPNRYYPTDIEGLTDVEELAISFNNACARKTDGSVWCWGSIDSGLMGDGRSTVALEPVDVVGFEAP